MKSKLKLDNVGRTSVAPYDMATGGRPLETFNTA